MTAPERVFFYIFLAVQLCLPWGANGVLFCRIQHSPAVASIRFRIDVTRREIS